MDLFLIALFVALGFVAFVISQLLVILWLLKENNRLQELAEENEPPF